MSGWASAPWDRWRSMRGGGRNLAMRSRSRRGERRISVRPPCPPAMPVRGRVIMDPSERAHGVAEDPKRLPPYPPSRATASRALSSRRNSGLESTVRDRTARYASSACAVSPAAS